MGYLLNFWIDAIKWSISLVEEILSEQILEFLGDTVVCHYGFRNKTSSCKAPF